MEHQIIKHDGKPAFVLVPFDEYNALMTSDEDFMRQARADDDGHRYPADLVDRIMDGTNPIKAVREWRNMTQGELASAAGLSDKNFISMLENGRRTLTDKTAAKLASALNVGVDILQD